MEKNLTNKIFFDPFCGNIRFWAISEKCYFGEYTTLVYKGLNWFEKDYIGLKRTTSV